MKCLEQRLEVTERRLRLCYEDKASDLTRVEQQLITENARLRVGLCASFAASVNQVTRAEPLGLNLLL